VPANDTRGTLEKARAWLLPALSVALFGAALWIIHEEFAKLHWRDVLAEAHGIRAGALLGACGLTAVSYWLLGLYDVLGFRYIRRRVSYARAAFVSFIAFAFGHNLSLAALTGAAVRFRLYASIGLSAAEIATLTAFVTVTAAAGLAIVSGTALIAEPAGFASVLHVAPVLAQVLGASALGFVSAYAAWALSSVKGLVIRGWIVTPPSVRLLTSQLTLAVADLLLSAGVLWVLLPSDANVGLLTFAGVYSLGVTAGLVSHVPGGLGVFEAVILLGLPEVPSHTLLVSLIVYRIIYYLAPLLIATLLFAGKELQAQRARIPLVARASGAYIAPLVPQVASVLTFIAGAVLLLSGATPALSASLGTLRHALPLPLLELSHLAGSIIGLALLVLSRSLLQRVAAARDVAGWLLVAGIVAALLRGPDIEAASMLAVAVAVLWLGRTAFYRPASVLEERFTPAWIASIAVVLVASIWLGFFAHRHVEYASRLWWTFAVDGDAPRMLRSSLVLALLAAAYFMANLLRPARTASHSACPEDLAQAKSVLQQEDRTLGQVVLAGDKRLLFAEARDAFLMYQVIGPSWIALGDPVGHRDRNEELVWRFRELSDRYCGRAAFYQVRAECLPIYIDLGFMPLKLGEEARVLLARFNLDSSVHAGLRQARRRGERAGLTFEVVPPEQALRHFDELARISKAWLATKNTAEKHFSVGAFSADYLANFPIMLVRRADALVAFANVWASATCEELSVDLMRFAPEAPPGTMDCLFVELMLWGRARGFRWFNLGMAPLAGLRVHRLAPRWNRMGRFVFRHGEHFYNFRGLRRYKEKFGPVWEPRYLVVPRSTALPRIVLDTSVLISGGLKELVVK
jgi:phosphatidylglycerol lysyltransferase